jgi:hypothetical protein
MRRSYIPLPLGTGMAVAGQLYFIILYQHTALEVVCNLACVISIKVLKEDQF